MHRIPLSTQKTPQHTTNDPPCLHFYHYCCFLCKKRYSSSPLELVQAVCTIIQEKTSALPPMLQAQTSLPFLTSQKLEIRPIAYATDPCLVDCISNAPVVSDTNPKGATVVQSTNHDLPTWRRRQIMTQQHRHRPENLTGKFAVGRR
jgi:hypothetical protein